MAGLDLGFAEDVGDNVDVGGSEGSLVLPMFIIPAAPPSPPTSGSGLSQRGGHTN